MTKTFILACDGGGIRGYITATVLSDLLASNAGNFLSQVTLNAGTSTGSFIALALAAGESVSTIVSLYQATSAKQIFQTNPNISGSSAPALGALRDRAATLGGIWNDILKYAEYFINASYTNAGLQTVASTLLSSGGSNPQPLTLSQLTPVLVNTVQLDDAGTWTPLTITNWGNTTYNNMLAYEAGMCSGAAPIYFPPFSPTSQTLGFCADGGLFANNPSLAAIAAAIQQGVAPSDLYVLSLDTGTPADGMSADYINGWGGPLSMGPAQWLLPFSLQSGDATTPKFPLLSALMDNASTAITQQAAMLLGANYFRVSVPLPTPVALDDFSPGAYTIMNNALSSWQSSSNYTDAVTWLTTNFPTS